MNKEIIKKIIYIVLSAALMIFAVIMLLCCIPEKKTQYDVVFMGDSIFGNFRDETSIPNVFASLSGLTVFNQGFGGTMASYLTEDNCGRDVVENANCLVSLTRAACLNDHTYIKAALPLRNVASLTYFPQAVEDTARVDYSGAKIIIIEHSLNDYFGDKPARSGSNPTDLNTVEGAIRYSVRMLKETYPDAILVLATPVGCYTDISEYVDAVKTVANEEDTYLFDAYGLEIVTNDNIGKVTMDNVHLNEEGRKIYSELLYEYMLDSGIL